MKFNNLIDELFVQFPFLKNVYEDEGDYIKDLQHLCFAIVFVPFIIQTYSNNNEKMIRSICDFMERMAVSEDELVSELLVVSVLETMTDEREILQSLKQYFGTHTLELLSVIEREYGWI